MKFNLLAPINSTGYGVASTNFLLAANKLGHTVSWLPLGGMPQADPAIHHILKACALNAQFFTKDNPTLKIWHQNDLSQNLGRGKLVAFPFFELDRFSELEAHHLSQQDALIVASEWAKNILKENNIGVPTYVAPLGVDRSIFNENIDISENKLAQNTDTKFLCVGKWEIRKGHDIVCEAFNRAFKKEDDVQLIMACHNPFLTKPYSEVNKNEEWAEMYKISPLGDKISIFGERLESQQQIAQLMIACDCGIFASRAEAWNLELLEMMSCGKHVIATNVTGHTEFINTSNCHILNTDKKMEWAFDDFFFDGKIGKWAALGEQQIDELAAHMKNVYEDDQNKCLKLNSYGIETAQRFSWENTVNKAMEALCP